VNHKILLPKLEYYGVTGICQNLIKSYLEVRHQNVVILNSGIAIHTTSSWELVRQGVPQGSVLGPLLFLIYINDFATSIKKYATPILFANDTSAIISSSNVNDFENSLSLVINLIENWCKNNVLTVNLKKTQFMQFVMNHNKIINLQVKVKYLSLLNTNNIKFLSITLNNKLMWKTYGSELSIKLKKPVMLSERLSPMCLKKHLPQFTTLTSILF
jgi:hypothetical protein